MLITSVSRGILSFVPLWYFVVDNVINPMYI